MFDFTFEEERVFHEMIAWGMIAVAVPTYFILAHRIPSPWGKTLDESKVKIHKETNKSTTLSSSSPMTWWLGFLLPARLAWFLFEVPNLIFSALCYTDCLPIPVPVPVPVPVVSQPSQQRNDKNDIAITLPWTNQVLLGLFVLHYIQRAIIYPLIMSKNTKKMPSTVVFAATLYTSCNGYLQAQSLCRFGPALPDDWLFAHWQGILGLLLFTIGMFVNLQSDAILRKLRSTAVGYQIPVGGLFRYVSAPHYLGEIVEWLGFCVASNGSLASIAFVLYTASNLIPRATTHHVWYKETFGDKYPKERRAVIPFVW